MSKKSTDKSIKKKVKRQRNKQNTDKGIKNKDTNKRHIVVDKNKLYTICLRRQISHHVGTT